VAVVYTTVFNLNETGNVRMT